MFQNKPNTWMLLMLIFLKMIFWIWPIPFINQLYVIPPVKNTIIAQYIWNMILNYFSKQISLLFVYGWTSIWLWTLLIKEFWLWKSKWIYDFFNVDYSINSIFIIICCYFSTIYHDIIMHGSIFTVNIMM